MKKSKISESQKVAAIKEYESRKTAVHVARLLERIIKNKGDQKE